MHRRYTCWRMRAPCRRPIGSSSKHAARVVRAGPRAPQVLRAPTGNRGVRAAPAVLAARVAVAAPEGRGDAAGRSPSSRLLRSRSWPGWWMPRLRAARAATAGLEVKAEREEKAAPLSRLTTHAV